MIWYITPIAITLCILYATGYNKLRKEGKSIKLLLAPFSFNLFFSCALFYSLLLMAIAIVHNFAIDISMYLLLIVPIIVQTITNLLLYFLYYKRKNKLTAKEYFLISLSGSSAVVMYMLWLELRVLF